ncbi:hypothetical protein TNCV_3749251 [Trichonephila clavipes]|nr:hypothetical protein TNCV_3749251 [Trichonephila clavipes]
MARKKNSANNSRKGFATSTSPNRTLSAGIPTLTHLENLHPSTSGSSSILNCSTEKIMDLSLPASTQSSRPGTPQDFTNISHSNCQGLLRLAEDIKTYNITINECYRGIKDLIQAGLTDPNNPIIAESTKVLEDYNQRYQQAVSEFTSPPPCDISVCTLHSTPNSTRVKNDSLDFPPLPKTTSMKRLPRDTKTSDIENDLIDLGFTVDRVTQLTGKVRGSYLSLVTALVPQLIIDGTAATPVNGWMITSADTPELNSESFDSQPRTFYSTDATTRTLIHSIWDEGFLLKLPPSFSGEENIVFKPLRERRIRECLFTTYERMQHRRYVVAVHLENSSAESNILKKPSTSSLEMFAPTRVKVGSEYDGV